tara:strand:- start:116411 stop:116815 length:405 start_codon:yes stop_codon:yes gene_type:complete
MMKSYLAASAGTFVIFVVIDFIWLSVMARLLYRPELGDLLAGRPALAPAVVFYFLYVVGLALLVVRPAIDAGSVITALWMGSLFGLVAYGTYDLTNAATLSGWSWKVTVVDMAWGSILTGFSAAAGVWLAGRLA